MYVITATIKKGRSVFARVEVVKGIGTKGDGALRCMKSPGEGSVLLASCLEWGEVDYDGKAGLA